MWISRISLDLAGDQFSPSALLRKLLFPHVVFRAHEATDSRHSGKHYLPGSYGFGGLSLLAPGKITAKPVADYEAWYLQIIETNYLLFQEHGVTEINLFMEVFYTKQCNFEFFTREALAKLGRYRVAVPISVYHLNDEQLIDLLQDAGWSTQQITRYVEQEA